MQELKLTAEGMHCRGCEILVSEGLGGIEGVKIVLADHTKGTILVKFEGRMDVERLKKSSADGDKVN
jgi:copper chaperone CopZ